jgi:xanthine dehydrogenase accessory factor
MKSEIWKAAAEQLDQGRHLALATILASRGSCPRNVGTRFLVDESGKMVGTVGGGSFEARVRDSAIRSIETMTSHRAVFTFCADEMVCGGEADVLVEFVAPDDALHHKIIHRLVQIAETKDSAYLVSEVPVSVGASTSHKLGHALIDRTGFKIGGFAGDCLELIGSLNVRNMLKDAQLTELDGWEHPVLLEKIKPAGTVYIFGAGHVGASVSYQASYVDFKVIVLDDRSDFASIENVPEADEIIGLDSYVDALFDLPIDEDSYIVIATRGHSHDKTVLEQALRTPARYIGMIGSRCKAEVISQKLLQEGFGEEDIRRVHSPIGLHLGGETPQELAVAIIAEIIQVRNGIDRQQGQGGRQTEQFAGWTLHP